MQIALKKLQSIFEAEILMVLILIQAFSVLVSVSF